ncbi:MAG: carbohydrate kinase, partial [Limosilactobacillus mucosae]|nr:carbohydrate kinase [Limosilactobacillus mucosae]
MIKNFLTIDNGGTNTKVIIFNQTGQQLAVEAFPTQGIEPQSGFHEIDLKKLRSDLGNAVKAVLAKAQLMGDDIAGIATVGHGKGLYVLDGDYQIFRNGILSADSRA